MQHAILDSILLPKGFWDNHQYLMRFEDFTVVIYLLMFKKIGWLLCQQLFLMWFRKIKSYSYNSFKYPVDWPAPRENTKAKYWLWVIMMFQCRFISCNKCTTQVRDVDNGGSQAYAEQEVHEKSLCFLLNFAVNLKLP